MNQENDLQKAIDDITKNSDAQKQADADLVAEIAAKFAEKAKAVPVAESGGEGAEGAGALGAEGAGALGAEMPGAEMPQIPEVGMPEGMPMPPNMGASMGVGANGGAGATDGGVAGAGVSNGGMINNNGGNMGGETGAKMDADVRLMKETAMRDLMPLMDKLELSAEQKFNLCLDMLAVLKDKSMLARAHEATRGIMDEGARARALVRFVDVLNEMK